MGAFSELLIGRRCEKCKEYGVTCSQIGLLNIFEVGSFSQVVIRVNNKPIGRNYEPIKEYPAVTGYETCESVANSVIQQGGKAKKHHTFTDK